MAASLTASFILKLEDRLSSGIVALSRKLESLAKLAGKVSLGGLDGADRALDRVGGAADRVSRKVEGVGRAARSAVDEIKRLSSQSIMVNGAGTAFLPPSVSRGMMAATVAAAVAAGGGGRLPSPPSASFMGPGSPLLLGGPGGGGIPLNPTRPMPNLAGPRFGGNVGALEAAVAGYSLEAPIRAAAELDKVLRQVAIIGTLSGKSAEAEITRLHTVLERESIETGQPVMRLAEAYRDLRNRGLDTDIVDKLLPIHGRAATAYNVDAESMGQAVSSLNKNLGIGHEEMSGALAAMAQATHEGTFTMTAMSHFLPTITGRMSMLGMRGRGSLDKVASALEVVSASSGDPNQTATNFTDMMIAMTQPYAKKAFKKVGIDLEGEMTAAERAGRDPMQTYISILRRMTKDIKGDVAKAFYLGKVLHNQQAGTAALALVQHEQEYLKLRDELAKIGPDKLDRDYGTAQAGLSPQMAQRDAKLKSLQIRLGEGFSWVVPVENAVLSGVVDGLGWMLDHFPTLTKLALGLAGGMLALVTTLGVLVSIEKVMGPNFLGVGKAITGLRAVLGFVIATVSGLARAFIMLQLAGGPVLWTIEAIALAGYLIYRNWDTLGPYFQRLWDWVRGIFWRFVAWVDGWTGGAMSAAIDKLKAAWEGLKGWFADLWNGVAGTFDGLISGIETRIAAIKQFLGLSPTSDGRRDRGPGEAPSALPRTPEEQQQRDTGTGMFTPSAYTPRAGGQLGFAPLEIKVTVDGPAKVDAPQRIQPIDRGPMLGRA